MVSQVDSLLRVRLDTLPAAELRRLAEPWCGRTEASDITSAADTLTPPQGLYATAQERVGAFTQEGLRAIAERWRHAREIFRDVDAATMFGDESSLSYGAQRDTVTLLSDRLSAADAPVQPASDMITHAADSLPIAGDSLSIAGDSLSLTGDSVFVAGDSLSGAADTVSLAANTLSAGAAGAADGHVAAVVAVVTDGNAATLAGMVGDVVQNLLVAVVVFLYFFCLYR